MGWNTSGLWSQSGFAEQDVAEIEAIESELRFRLSTIQRAALSEMKDILNYRVKHREPFRPYAPSVLVERSRERAIVDEAYPGLWIPLSVIASERAGMQDELTLEKP